MLRNREMVATKLQRIGDKARIESICRFTSLFHLMNVEMLRECFRQLRKDAAAGIDKVTKKEYGLSLEKNLAALRGRGKMDLWRQPGTRYGGHRKKAGVLGLFQRRKGDQNRRELEKAGLYFLRVVRVSWCIYSDEKMDIILHL